MAIPKFFDIMLPLLQFCSDKNEHSLQEAIEYLSAHFDLSDEDTKKLLPSGTMTVIKNRVGWARTYLAKAGLLEATRRGHFQITQSGVDELKFPPDVITPKYLQKYERFREFQNISKGGELDAKQDSPTDETTPEERLEDAFVELNTDLANGILDRIISCSPFFFEQLVVNLLLNLGYGGSRAEAGKAFATSGDGGVDGIIKEDRLGLDLIYIQAKRWKKDSCIGRPEIQKFAGALQGVRAKKGVFIATSSFTKEAEEYVKNIDTKIILIDGKKLTDLMIESSTGVSVVNRYEVKKIDNDFFNED